MVSWTPARASRYRSPCEDKVYDRRMDLDKRCSRSLHSRQVEADRYRHLGWMRWDQQPIRVLRLEKPLVKKRVGLIVEVEEVVKVQVKREREGEREKKDADNKTTTTTLVNEHGGILLSDLNPSPPIYWLLHTLLVVLGIQLSICLKAWVHMTYTEHPIASYLDIRRHHLYSCINASFERATVAVILLSSLQCGAFL